MPAGAVGIIGVGALGLVVAERLLAAQFRVEGYRRGSLTDFTALGGVAAPSASAVARLGNPLILLLPNDAALEQVIADITPVLHPRQIVLCLGTHRISAKRAAAEAANAVGSILLDGEISGTPAMLRAGQGSVMIAGDIDAVERVRPVLEAFARHTIHAGEFGDAARMKLVTNFLVGVHTLAAAEALLLAQRLGLEPRLVVATLEASAASSTMLSVRGRMMAERNIKGAGMKGFIRFFELLNESLSDAGETSGPLLDFTEDLYRRAAASGHGDSDIAAIYEYLNETRRSLPEEPLT